MGWGAGQDVTFGCEGFFAGGLTAPPCTPPLGALPPDPQKRVAHGRGGELGGWRRCWPGLSTLACVVAHPRAPRKTPRSRISRFAVGACGWGRVRDGRDIHATNFGLEAGPTRHPRQSGPIDRSRHPWPSGPIDRSRHPRPSRPIDRSRHPWPSGPFDRSRHPRQSGPIDRSRHPRPSGLFDRVAFS